MACGDPPDTRFDLATAALDELLAATPPAGRTPGTNQAIAELVRDQFKSVGIEDVTIEEFSIPVSASQNHSLSFAGAAEVAGMHEHQVNVFGGDGTVQSAGVFDLGLAMAPDPAAAGKVALVDFSVTRSLRSQYRNAVASGAVGAIIDSKIDALRQRNVWTLAGAMQTDGPIPVVTVQQADAAALRDQLQLGTDVRVDLATDAAVTPMRAYNVIARVPGTKYPERTLLINGHLDSWFTGSADDGQSVAALIALAKALHDDPLPYTVELVALDCEETFLLGSNNYIRQRMATVRDTLVGAISLEMLAPKNLELSLLTVDPKEVWEPIFEAAGLTDVFKITLTPSDQMTAFGGEVPSDQGTFWQFGIPGGFVVSTYNEYHTTLDDASNINPERYKLVLASLEASLREVGKLAPEALATRPQSSIELQPTLATQKPNRITGSVSARGAQSQTEIADAVVTVTLFSDGYDAVLASTQATFVAGMGYTFQLDYTFASGTPYVLSFDALVAGTASGRALLPL
jgi:Zn-dependent M28 family amino/carboxypeptidase